MFEINETSKIITNQPLTKKERFKILNSKRINPQVVEYLTSKLNELEIEVSRQYKGSIFELMRIGVLEGWCWETTESAIVFFNDNDYIERGNLKFETNYKYYHSWICFNFDKTEYVLDPCLNFLCKKDDYYKIFEIEVKGKVTAKAVKEELIKQITTFKEEEEEETSEDSKNFDRFWKSFLKYIDESYSEKKRKEVVVHNVENVNAPFYRNCSGYTAEFQDKKIKKLTVHYYSGF